MMLFIGTIAQSHSGFLVLGTRAWPWLALVHGTPDLTSAIEKYNEESLQWCAFAAFALASPACELLADERLVAVCRIR